MSRKPVQVQYQSHGKQAKPGMSLVEILMVLFIMAVIATMSIGAFRRDPKKVWNRQAEDYIHQLSSIYNQTTSKFGDGPLAAQEWCASGCTCVSPATEPCFQLRFSNGIDDVLSTYETTAIYDSTSPENMDYPKDLVVYLDPDDSNVPDPSNEIPNDAAAENDILDGTDDREWVLLDMNGSDLPNSIASDGDRVLLYIDDDTGQILTAKQICDIDPLDYSGPCTEGYGQSFYDVYKGY